MKRFNFGYVEHGIIACPIIPRTTNNNNSSGTKIDKTIAGIALYICDQTLLDD